MRLLDFKISAPSVFTLALIAALIGLVVQPITNDLVRPEIRAALIGGLATLTTGLVGAGLVVWQMDKQARNARDSNRHSEGLQLRLGVYREMIATIGAAGQSLAKLQAYMGRTRVVLAVASHSYEQGRPWLMPDERPPHLIDLQTEAASQCVQFIAFVENWAFLVPRIGVFQVGFNAALYDLQEANRAYVNAAMELLPMDRIGGTGEGTLPWTPPSASQLARLDSAHDTCMSSISTLHAYSGDFRIEMQKALLGELFSHEISHRIPIDPNSKVISLADADQLIEHFKTKTSWGRWTVDVEEAARAHFKR